MSSEDAIRANKAVGWVTSEARCAPGAVRLIAFDSYSTMLADDHL